MFWVYVLKSLKTKKRYTGYTSRDVALRLKEHNSGKGFWDRNNKPFVLLYKENASSLEKAKKREKFLKSGQGRIFLNKTIPL